MALPQQVAVVGAQGEEAAVGTVPAIPARTSVAADDVDAAATLLRGDDKTLLLLGGESLFERPLALAGEIATATGCDVMAECFNSRTQRGAGRNFF